MSARLLWTLVGAVVLFYGAFRLATLDARLDALANSVARLEQSSPSEIDAPTELVRAAVDGGVASRLDSWSMKSMSQRLALLSQEVDTLRAQLKKAPLDPDQIIDVVERKNEAVFARKLEFHRERWLEARENGLDRFSKAANLTPIQRERLDVVVTDEVDRIMDILRDPIIRDDPEQLIEAWDEVLSSTDREVRRILAPFQRERWEEARAFERKVFFPWLPK